MWHPGVERERKHSITPGDARTFANPTCGASARLVNLYCSYVCNLLCFALLLLFLTVFFLRYTVRRGVRYGACSCFYYFHFYFYFYFWAAYNPSRCFSLTAVSVSVYLSFFFLFNCCPSFPPPSFLVRCMAHYTPCPCPCLPIWVVWSHI